jgi:hypothetical protein
MSGAIPQLPNTPPWHGAQLKAGGQLYLLQAYFRIRDGYGPDMIANKVMGFYTRAVWEVHGLAAMRRCYAEGGDDCYAKL